MIEPQSGSRESSAWQLLYSTQLARQCTCIFMKRSQVWAFLALPFITHGDNLRKDLSERKIDDPTLPGGGRGGVRIIFGVQTSAIPRYEEKLKEGFATWIDRVPREDRIIVGPRCNEINCKQKFWEPTACDDTSNLCKPKVDST